MRRTLNNLGLTLIELLVAMSIFSVLGLFLFVMMRDALGIYRGSRGAGEIHDKYDQLVRTLENDLSCISIGDPEGDGPKLQVLLTRDREYVPPADSAENPAEATTSEAELKARNAWATGDPRSLLLRFVRSFPGGELEDTVGRFAGTYPGGEAYIDGVDDLEESRAYEIILKQSREGEEPAGPGTVTQLPGLRAPENLVEVLWFVDRGPDDRPGSYTIYRAQRSPIGGPGSFFDPQFKSRMTQAWIERHATPVVTGVAYFGVVAKSQNTVDWRTEEVLAGAFLESKNHDAAELWWDSTRARHRQFSLGRGSSSADDWEDDVFPQALRFVFTLTEEGVASGDAQLIGTLPANQRLIRISDPELFADLEAGEFAALRLGDEWLGVDKANGRDLRVRRGMRQTYSVAHAAGTPIVVGRTFSRTIRIPAFRSWFRGPGEQGQ